MMADLQETRRSLVDLHCGGLLMILRAAVDDGSAPLASDYDLEERIQELGKDLKGVLLDHPGGHT